MPTKFHWIESELFSLFRRKKCSFRGINDSEWNAECFSSAKWLGKKFPAFVSSAELFITKLHSSKCFSLLRKSSEQNSKLFCLPQNGSEWNSERFPFRETGVIPKERIKISFCSVFRGINFSRKMATLTATQGEKLSLHCYYTSLSPSPAKTFSISFIYFLCIWGIFPFTDFTLSISIGNIPSDSRRRNFPPPATHSYSPSPFQRVKHFFPWLRPPCGVLLPLL